MVSVGGSVATAPRWRHASGRGGGTESTVICSDAETAEAIDLPAKSLTATSVITIDVVPGPTAWNCTMATLPPATPGRWPDTALEQDLWTCRADATQLETALLNLAINARDAMPTGGQLAGALRPPPFRAGANLQHIGIELHGEADLVDTCVRAHGDDQLVHLADLQLLRCRHCDRSEARRCEGQHRQWHRRRCY